MHNNLNEEYILSYENRSCSIICMRALIPPLSFFPELPEWKDFTQALNDSGHHIAVMCRLVYL